MLDNQGMPERQPQTWESNILVPLTQNIVGAIALAVTIACISHTWNRLNSLPTDINDLTYWSVVIAAITAGCITVIRFFADDFGILKAAYRAGQQSRNEEIHRLNREIAVLQQQSERPTNTADTHEKIGKMKADFENAKTLLVVALGGGNIARDSEDHDLTKHPWGRAVRLLIKAKVIEEHSNKLLITSRQKANAQLSEYFAMQCNQAKTASFQPSWW